jgi:peptide/nickel transport system substrate-binding protein
LDNYFVKNLKKLKEISLNFFHLKKNKAYQDIKLQTDLDKKMVFSLAKSRFPNLSQIKFINSVLSKKESNLIKICIGIIIICLIFIGFRFYQRHVQYLPESGGKYVEALIGTPKYVNPIFLQSNDVDLDLSKLIYSSLIKYSKNHELVPDLAEKYEISEDQKTYTFYLKKDIKWHDGEPFNADDVVFTIETIQNNDFKSPLHSNFNGVTVEKIDDYTIRFVLKEPFSPFLANLTVGIIPEHIWMDVDPNNISLVEYNLKPIGSGPFKFKALTRDKFGNIKSYLVVRNEEYYFKKPYLDEITFRFYPDITTASEAVKSKSVEAISYIPKELKDSLIKGTHLLYHTLKLPQYTAVFFNQKNNEVLKVKEIREALACSIDRQKIIDDVLGGDAEIINSAILPGSLGYNPDVLKYEYNPDQANELLEKAGWKKEGDSPVRKKGNQELKLTLTTVNTPEYSKITELIKGFWEKIGVAVEIKLIENTRIEKDVIAPRDYQILLYGELVGFDPDPYPFWHSSQQRDPGLSLAIFYKKEVDKLLEVARKTSNNNERADKYREFSRIIAEDIPAIFLYSPTYTYGLPNKIKGLVLKEIISPSDRFTGIEDWYIKTKRSWK